MSSFDVSSTSHIVHGNTKIFAALEFCKDPDNYLLTTDIVNEYLPNGETVLTFCIKEDNFNAVCSLLHNGADPHLTNKKGSTPLSVAAKKGSVEIMKRLLLAGCSIEKDTKNDTGSTALLQAAHFGQLESVKFLIDNGVDCTLANKKGTTALMRASQEGHLDIVKCIIDCKVDVNAKNIESMNALMLASQRGHADTVKLLCGAGANIDEQTCGHWRAMGSSALMLACHRGHVGCVEALLMLGANTTLRDFEGLTALGVTLKKKRKLQEPVSKSNDVNSERMMDNMNRIAELLKANEIEKRRLSKDTLEQTVSFVEELSLSTDWIPVERSASLEEYTATGYSKVTR